jgi:hypothetical protein
VPVSGPRKKGARARSAKTRNTKARDAKARLLKKLGITLSGGRPRRGGKFISKAALARALSAAAAAQRGKGAKPKKAKTQKPKKPTPQRPARTKHAKPTKPAKRAQPITREEALAALPPEERAAAIAATAKKKKVTPEKLPSKTEKAKETKQKTKEETQRKGIKTAKDQLENAVKIAAKNGGKLYGIDPKTGKQHKVKGTFAGFKRIKFEDRAQHVQAVLRQKFADWRRDVLVQSVHIREYLVQGDGGAGRRAVIEKVLRAGRHVLATRAKKNGKPLRVYQIYISTIRILIRQEDAGKYGGYSTHPIKNKKAKAATDIRGLEGFETVAEGEDPKIALDRILERLDNHLDDILDGLPVVYVKSLQLKFDVEAQ